MTDWRTATGYARLRFRTRRVGNPVRVLPVPGYKLSQKSRLVKFAGNS
jgi:hypothetical protein